MVHRSNIMCLSSVYVSVCVCTFHIHTQTNTEYTQWKLTVFMISNPFHLKLYCKHLVILFYIYENGNLMVTKYSYKLLCFAAC